MKLKLKIQQKIQIFIITAAIIIYVVAVGYISFSARKMAYNNAIELTDKTVNSVAEEIGGKLSKDISISITLTNSFKTIRQKFSKDEWQDFIDIIYKDVFSKNQQIYALWDSWELSAIDTSWKKSYGRITNNYWRENNQIMHSRSNRSMDGDSEVYAETKSKLTPSVNEPYLDALIDNSREALLMTSLNSPLVENGKYIGVVSLDITLKQFQEMMKNIKPYEGSVAFLISNKGIISGHPHEDFLNKNISTIFPNDEKIYKITQNIALGKSLNYISSDENGIKTYYSYAPIKIAETNTPWSIAISVPIKTIMRDANINFIISIVIGVIGILLLALVISIISKNITNPLSKITELIKRLAKGHIDEKMRIKIQTGDEIEEMSNALNSSIEGLNKKVVFANHIEQGELTCNFDLLSDEDVLGKSLIDMRNSLVKAKEEDEKRKIEDEKRRWTNEGLAQFSDILRQNNDNLENLATEIIMNLVNYIKANQGGLFILNDENSNDIHFSLLSAYAFSRRKHKQKIIQMGEGLVGTCALEKETIYLTEIPQNYIEITSGLGGSNPNSLLLVPLKLEGKVLGVIEIASFNTFEPHEIEFIEKLAESIASTLSSVRINIQTNMLLEKSQQQAEEMAAQEEEMRQNMEELQATQEESTRKGIEMEGLVEALNLSCYVIEYDLEGYIQEINDNFLSFTGLNREEVIGTHHSENLKLNEKQLADYDMFWRELKNGKIQKQTTKIKIKGKDFIFNETYTPIKNSDEEIYKILKISNNLIDFQSIKNGEMS